MNEKKKVIGRLDICFLSTCYDNWALSTSSPIYDIEEGKRKYFEAVENEKCVDDYEQPAKVHLWIYSRGKSPRKTIAKNYEGEAE